MKHKFAEELLSYSDIMSKIVFSSFKGDPVKEVGENLNSLGPGIFLRYDSAFVITTVLFGPTK